MTRGILCPLPTCHPQTHWPNKAPLLPPWKTRHSGWAQRVTFKTRQRDTDNNFPIISCLGCYYYVLLVKGAQWCARASLAVCGRDGLSTGKTLLKALISRQDETRQNFYEPIWKKQRGKWLPWVPLDQNSTSWCEHCQSHMGAKA